MSKEANNQKKNYDVFETMPVPKAVATMAIPTIIGQLIVLFYNMADTYFLGRTNNPAMVAGASLILPVYNICLSLAGLSGAGGGALMSRLLGSKKKEEAKKVGSFSVYLCIFTATLFSLVTFLFMKPLMGALGASAETFSYAKSYALFVIVFGGVPTVLSNTLATLLRSVGYSKKAGFGITMGGIINIALDPLFMFVIFPKGMEIVGAGVATCLSNCISCIFFIVVIVRMEKDSVLRLCPPNVLPQKSSIANIFSVGIPSSVATLLFDLDYVILDKLMSGYNDLALAAVGIVLKVERLPLNVGIGICQGMMPIVAYNYSAKNLDRMKKVKNFSMIAGLVCAAISIAGYETFAGPIIRFFIEDAKTMELGTVFLRIRCLATPLMFLSFFHVYIFNGFGKGGYALFLGVMRWAVFNIPMLYLLNYLIGMYGLVWSQVTADTLTVALSIFVYYNYKRKHLKC